MWQSLEKVVAVAGGCVVAAHYGHPEVGTTVGAAMGAAGIIGFFGERSAKHGPESGSYLSKIRSAVLDDLGNPPRWPDVGPATVEGWDWSLGEALPDCMLDRRSLAGAVVDREGFSAAATRIVLAQLSERDSQFAEPPARDFAERVIERSLSAAYEDRAYFETLAPYLWAALGQTLDQIKETGEATNAGVMELLASRQIEHLRAGPEDVITRKCFMLAFAIQAVWDAKYDVAFRGAEFEDRKGLLIESPGRLRSDASELGLRVPMNELLKALKLHDTSQDEDSIEEVDEAIRKFENEIASRVGDEAALFFHLSGTLCDVERTLRIMHDGLEDGNSEFREFSSEHVKSKEDVLVHILRLMAIPSSVKLMILEGMAAIVDSTCSDAPAIESAIKRIRRIRALILATERSA